MPDEQTRERINRLYWDSDGSVGDIADQLGVSRRALYESIDPRPAGVDCSECGGPLGFRNRTMAQNLEAECGACGHLTTVATARLAAEAAAGRTVEDPAIEEESSAARGTPLRRRQIERDGALGGALLAGVALGALAGFLLRRR